MKRKSIKTDTINLIKKRKYNSELENESESENENHNNFKINNENSNNLDTNEIYSSSSRHISMEQNKSINNLNNDNDYSNEMDNSLEPTSDNELFSESQSFSKKLINKNDNEEDNNYSDNIVSESETDNEINEERNLTEIDENDDEENEIEKEIITNRMKLNSSVKKTSDIGTIESVELWNFMCHERLKIDFCPRINFVVGHNGSGKSAILTGITVCLGGKATITQRATSLKGLIKEGKNNGSVTIKIRNKGHDAYKPEIYGERIIIERRLSKDGVNGYKIKNSSGKVIASNRKELNNILDHMCIQVDNPMNILNQDLARQFISSSTPEEKYNFFLKGTQLDQLNEDLELVRERIDKIDRIIKLKLEVLPEMKKEIKSIKAECKDMMAIQNLEKTSKELKKQLAWAEIEEKEHELYNEEENYKREMKNLNLRVKKLKDIQTKMEPYNTKIKTNREKIIELTEKYKPINEKKKDVEYNLKEIYKKRTNLQHENQKMALTMTRLLHQKEEFEEKINDEKKKIENINNNERGRQEIEIEELNKAITNLTNKITEINNDLKNNNREIMQVRKDKDNYESENQAFQNEINMLNKNIYQLESQKKNRVRAFHDKYPEILEVIEEYDRKGMWKEGKPVGPFGLYITLKNKKWSTMIETLLKNFVSAMGVFSHDDRKLMQSILNKYRCNAAVYVCKKKRIDFSKGEPDKEYLTVLRAIECDNEVVVQQLVVNARIEQILLIEDRKQADIVMSTGPNNGFPTNVAACYTLEGYQVGSKGGYATLSVNLYNGPPRLLTDVDDVIRENKFKIDNLIRNRNRKEDDIRKCQNSISNLNAQKQNMKDQLEKIQREINQRQSRKMQIQEEMEEKTPEDISSIEKKLSAVLNQINILEKQRSELKEQMDSIEKEEEKLTNEIKEIDYFINMYQDDIDKLQSEISGDWKKQMENLNDTLKHYSNEVESQYKSNQELEKKIEEMKKALSENIELAKQFCERVPVKKSKEELENQLRAIKQQQIQKHFDHETFNSLLNEYQNKTIEYTKAKEEIEKHNKFVMKLKESVGQRMKKWYMFRTFISMRAKNIFSELLLRRGYTGSLKFSHPNRQLILKVQIEDQAQVNASGNESYEKDPKSLSGGEKSFSTICLLLSLWETMACPIRGLDEFDVFMDAVNRRISMKMLIESARDTAQTQYIMITPQDMSNIQDLGLDNSLRIIRMDDPERRKADVQ
ncbi:P-loop containing nucleoside triphosphate hydrolase protein [Piromyces finnis]|uniref:p-loop containing nucleoside triphosphate hydrolase protein n=1 Tax=Piromyces finnis TaxID=1754191 RepID=A0A1Y1VN00_9FUNG|nr:P-loop containing nucleoside triphosphate hydrolase protein [Piromyces finnis]|eukprot:ORX60808.1 P-loop containing nucleoside triphosphate hydrolase protein [Piromyces finnis]